MISPTPLKLINATVIDGTGSAPLTDAAVVTDADGRLAYVGPAAGAPEAPDARVLDLGGRTVLPGFFDCHVHLAVPSGVGPFYGLRTDPVVQTFGTAERIRATLDAGVTTVRDLGGTTTGFRQAIEQGLITGPRLQLAVTVIGHTGGHTDHAFPGGEMHLAGGALGAIADTPDEARKAARTALRSGADLIKICTTGGMGSPHDDPEDEGLRLAEVEAVVDEGVRHGGRPVASHAQGTAGIITALRGGVRSIEHGYGVNDEALDLLAERGAFLVPTLSTVYAGIDKDRMEPYHYQKKIRWTGITKTNIAHAIERGAKIALGTDSGVGPHGHNLAELGYLVDLGMEPLAAITAGTLTAAQLLGVDDRLGTLEAGKIADLVITGVDPVADITGLGDPANVLLVAKDGIIVKDLLTGCNDQ